ncbi:hypothetical protein O181_120721 [Austropuccinia psidii MF-1]|uniref:Uncharacterized protein n=1 Tax=Austropuccinia psidii MF-1 TaxID=1389203 RepID=A0A9Q3KIZ3_9BASI|nr:hypothetical protein [Austropuccinia psidii MF-1]
MSSKLTELTESSPSAPPPSVLCGSGVFSRLSSPSMASSGHFDPSQPMMGTEQLKFLILPVLNVWPRKPCHCTGVSSSSVSRYLWSRNDWPFGKEFPVSEAPTPDGTSEFFQLVASIPTTITPSSPSTSHARPALNPAVKPSPSQQPRNSPITTSKQLQPVASCSRRMDVTREDPNAESETQEAVARFFRRVDRNSREVIMYANDRTIPGTASEEMAAKFAWYEDELINDFQRTFDDLGRDN